MTTEELLRAGWRYSATHREWYRDKAAYEHSVKFWAEHGKGLSNWIGAGCP